MISKKGQAGLDFLMTYGWALLLIVLVVGALFALGIFNVGSFTGSKAAGFAQLTPVGWQLATDGTLTVKFSNHAGTDVNVINVTAKMGSTTKYNDTAFTIDNGEISGTVTISGLPSKTAGSTYSIKLTLKYTDMATNFEYEDGGTITGKAV